VIGGYILPQYYKDHAMYHVKTAQAYEAEGVHINYMTLNNEPSCCVGNNYPTVWQMSGDDMATMLKTAWFPAWQANKITTKILLHDWNFNLVDLYTPLVNDSEIRNSTYVGGIAWHGYDHSLSRPTADPLFQYGTQVYEKYGLQGFLTERSGESDGSAQHQNDMHLMVGCFRNWVKSFVKWPVATDEKWGPNIGGCNACRGLIKVHINDSMAGEVEYKIEYYTMGHLTKFVRVGAYRIDSTDDAQILNIAFKNPDGSIVLIAYNNGITDIDFKVYWSGLSFNYNIPALASVTFKWNKN